MRASDASLEKIAQPSAALERAGDMDRRQQLSFDSGVMRSDGNTQALSRTGKPIQNSFIESLNDAFRDECLNANWFENLADARR